MSSKNVRCLALDRIHSTRERSGKAESHPSLGVRLRPSHLVLNVKVPKHLLLFLKSLQVFIINWFRNFSLIVSLERQQNVALLYVEDSRFIWSSKPIILTLIPINLRNLTFWSLFPKLSFSHSSAVWDLSFNINTWLVLCKNTVHILYQQLS